MKCLLFFAFLGFAVSASAQSADVAAIKQLNEDWIHNYVAKDKSTWERIFADDFFLINPAGKRFTKAEILGFPPQPIVSSRVDTAEVQVVGNLGFIHARCSFTMVTDGKESKGATDYLDVYEKRKGRWWAIAAHVIYLGDR